MAVLTNFYRVRAEKIELLGENPELMDWLLGYSHDPSCGGRLGFFSGAVPPRLNISEAWDEILLLLAGTGHHEAYQALHISLWEEYDGCEEIRVFMPAIVKKNCAALDAVRIERLRSVALQRDLRTYQGEPAANLLDETLAHFERLREFWRAAEPAGEAIIAATG